ncbi:MAG TPA: hypothetical protein VM012_03445, partial [Flavitalea sp.]|nr:hypothetical protein [Flavitalea sp.]
NTQIRHVLLGFSYHNLSSYFDTYIDGRDAKYLFSDYFFIVPYQEKLVLLNRRKKLLPEVLPQVMRKYLPVWKDPGKLFLGGYKPQQQRLKDTSTIYKRILVQFYSPEKKGSYSEMQFRYLQRIFALCKQHNVTLQLLQMPTNLYYEMHVPVNFKRVYDSLILHYGVPHILFDNFHLPDSLYMPDGDHLNHAGADSATLFLRKKLED